ncbi:hypothetical protein KC901_02370 [Patescibacteria group bacterium]|nr:hypothetical protein [Patescibacteria group bacterium]
MNNADLKKAVDDIHQGLRENLEQLQQALVEEIHQGNIRRDSEKIAEIYKDISTLIH